MASLALGLCAGLVHNASGQAITTLVDFDTVWRYDQSGMEAHQVSLSSSDVVWGARLAAIGPLPLSLTQQPQSQVAAAGDSVTFSIEVAGGPAFYQWQKDEVDILNATNASFSISPVSPSSAGIYRAVVTNLLGTLISSNAALTVFADSRGPVITSAILREDIGSLNAIDVAFDEQLLSINRDDIRVIRSGTFGAGAVSATVENIVYGGRTIRLRVGGPNWDVSHDYYILASNVTDSRGNVIAPLSVFPLTIHGREGLVPTNGPAPLLRLTPTLLAGHPPRLKLTWPSNANDIYYGYSLKEAKVLTNPVPARVFSVVPNQANGLNVPATDAARYYRLERGPNSGR